MCVCILTYCCCILPSSPQSRERSSKFICHKLSFQTSNNSTTGLGIVYTSTIVWCVHIVQVRRCMVSCTCVFYRVAMDCVNHWQKEWWFICSELNYSDTSDVCWLKVLLLVLVCLSSLCLMYASVTFFVCFDVCRVLQMLKAVCFFCLVVGHFVE